MKKQSNHGKALKSKMRNLKDLVNQGQQIKMRDLKDLVNKGQQIRDVSPQKENPHARSLRRRSHQHSR